MSKNSFFRNKKKKDDDKLEDKKDLLDTSFVLKNINPAKLDRNYSMKDIQNYPFRNISSSKSNQSDLKNLTTTLENLGISDKIKEPSLVFIDNGHEINMYTTFNNSKGDINRMLLMKNLNYKCWYCKNNIPHDILPISLPIKYYPSYIESIIVDNRQINQIKNLEYRVSDKIPVITNDNDKIFYDKRYLTVNEREEYESKPNTDKSKLIKNEYFDGEGIFCSFNCMLGYYYDNQTKNVRYKDTPSLIYLLYYYLYGKYPDKLKKASSWKLLKEFGGDQSIEEFRKNFSFVSYTDMNQYIKRIPLGPASELFMEES